MNNSALVWFRQDLRLADNPALYHAATENEFIIPLYIFDETLAWSMGRAQQWWLHHSLLSLQQQFNKLGLDLILRRGNSRLILLEICKKYNINHVYWNRCYEAAVMQQDQKINQQLITQGIAVNNYNSSLLHEPWEISNKQGDYFKVFTPFWNKCLAVATNIKLLPTPKLKQHPKIVSESLSDWQLLPNKPNWAIGFSKIWQPGEINAQRQFQKFLSEHLEDYPEARDFPAKNATSKLSPYLHFGEISPRHIWHNLKLIEAHEAKSSRSCEHFLRQLGWREFSYYLLYHFPHFADENFKSKFNHFSWSYNKKSLALWQQGQTGYPIVDAGMRELWHSGYMHNRVRMIVASFLTKHLLIDWRQGAKWFWNTLVDADLANNSMGWQWVAGSGADAAPYYRIFNPILQGEKFDAKGEYVRRWLPELSKLPNTYLHKPWKASKTILHDAGIYLDKNYPNPIVDHDVARLRALERYKLIK